MLPMSKRVLVSLVLCLPTALYAGDFTYQQTTQLTGGSLFQMMKTMGTFSSQARHAGDPVVSTIYLKDNRFARVSPDNIEIIDLDKETITHIDVQKKTYTVMTFDQVKQAIQNARQQMQQQAAQQPQPAPAANPNAQNVQMSFDVKVNKTGAQKEISGLQSSEAILTMVMTATDQQTQQSGNLAITNDMWMVPEIPGYGQVRDFYKRFAAKMGDSFTGASADFSKAFAQNPGAGQAFGDMTKEMEKLDGVPIMQVMRMGMSANGQPLPAASEAPTPAATPSPSTPSAGDAAKQGLASALSSHFGGFGGFGKKKQSTPPPDQNSDQAAAQAQQNGGILMEAQTTTTNFSSAPVDPSHFDIPAGYKQVQPPASAPAAPTTPQ